ncbi:flagellar basal body-associated FliL family protein [Oceanimonas sp. NS1]|uniref:Flagellar protein FliL n=1 Tax=Oceanimonas doudoroffii TaxID=84158 RepID=A0A233RDN8_9GAMM|nr:flagellar basal body-associated FliL family protein [Oceanimonas doudoroffii]MCT7654763.1 flagellar basal body-associated FliL family protein [Oceanimonas sp. NS1]OXY81511.1 flagellar basal body-associated protein FliL [Oceanimonas doudoroffii]
MFRFVALCLLLVSAGPLSAQDEPAAPAGPIYYTMTPDIITNYQNSGQNLGYVRVAVDLMLERPDQLTVVEENMPLLRDALNDLLAQKSRQEIRSLPARTELADQGRERLNELLLEETGQTPVRRLLFTTFLYQ